MGKKEENLGFEDIVQEFELPSLHTDNVVLNEQTEESEQAFPFEGEAVESAGTGSFDMPAFDEVSKELSLPNMEEPSVVEFIPQEKEIPMSLRNKENDDIPEIEMPDEKLEEVVEPIEEVLTEEAVEKVVISSEAPESIQTVEPIEEIVFSEALPEQDTNNFQEAVVEEKPEVSNEETDFDTIISQLSNELKGADHVASEIKEKKGALKKLEAELIEQQEQMLQEKEELKKTIVLENEKMELKRIENEEYMSKQRKLLEEAEAQMKVTMQTKEQEFQNLKIQMEAEKQQLDKEKMEFAVEKASAEERVRKEREEIEKENAHLTESSTKLKMLLEQFNSVSEKIKD